MSAPTFTSSSASASVFSDTRFLNPECLGAGQGFLVLPSRLNEEELLLLESALGGRGVTYLVEQGGVLNAGVQAHLERPSVKAVVFVADEAAAGAFQAEVVRLVAENEVLVYVPVERASLNAPLTTVPGFMLRFLTGAGVPVLPLYVHRPRDYAIGIDGADAEQSVMLVGGALLSGERATVAGCQAEYLRAAERCFSGYAALDLSLPYALIKGFKKHGARNHIVDGKDERKLGYDKVFAAALALSRVIKKETQRERVAIVLPPGIGGFVANMAVIFAGKIPVNLNFTASHEAIRSSMKQAGVDRFITADLFVRKMQSFPWPPNKDLIFIERLLPGLKPKIALWLLLAKLLPASLLASVLGLRKRGGNEEALLLFTSGSSGEPKGVVLSHRNLISNVIQFGSRLHLSGEDSILACLPLFHSFGCTVTLWYPVIEGVNLVSNPSPLETKRLAELVEKYRVSLMLATPTFLRGYLRGVNREQLGSLKLVITGAEKLPPTIAEAFRVKFGHAVLEGYGLTETSPVSNVNLPDPEPLVAGDRGSALVGHRPGSVGQLMPGLALRITHPESGEELPLDEPGMIWFKGPNVFTGYLNDVERSAEVLKEDGWFRTGDVGRLDEDGFLYIEGRLSRFSKIGGEMVPHETVEDSLTKALNLENEDTRRIAVVGVSDPERGEALVLLSTLGDGQDLVELRHRLLEAGVPALWIPKVLKQVPEIPVLASGKLDVQACVKLAAC